MQNSEENIVHESPMEGAAEQPEQEAVQPIQAVPQEDEPAVQDTPEAEVPAEEAPAEPVSECVEVMVPQKKKRSLFSVQCLKSGWSRLKNTVVRHKWISGAILLALVLILAAGLALFSAQDGYMMLTQDEYQMLTELSSDSAVSVATVKSNAVRPDLVTYSPDGKYVYFYTKFDQETESGSLYRVQKNKLSNNTLRIGKYIQLVDTRVDIGCQIMEDGTVLYTRLGRNLYGYRNGTSTLINSNVDSYRFDEDNFILYSVSKRSTYGVRSSDLSNSILLAADYDDLTTVSETDYSRVLFTLREEDNWNLYTSDFEGTRELLAEKADIVARNGDKIYFTQHNGTYLNLYDYVTDTCEKEDMALEEPNKDDYCDPVYKYRWINGNNLKESDFLELYTSCSENLYMYSKDSYWSNYAMEDTSWRSWGKDKNKAIKEASQNFINKYASQEDENGMIKVTEEVKADLLKIQKAFGETAEWKWMWLCYEKYVYDEQLNEAEYNAAVRDWENAKARIALRQKLRDPENAYPVKTLLCYDSGKITTVAENVLDTDVYGNLILHNDTTFETDPLDIKVARTVARVWELFEVDYDDQNYVIATETAAISRLSKESLATIRKIISKGGGLYIVKDTLYAYTRDGALSEAFLTEGVIGEFDNIHNNVYVLAEDGEKLYFYCNSYENQDMEYCDLYVYENGSSKCLARDILFDMAILYEDGKLLVNTGFKAGFGYEAALIEKNGTVHVLGNSITSIARTGNSEVLYISEGDLYCSSSGKQEKLQEDVRYFWCDGGPEVAHVLGANVYDLDVNWNQYFSSMSMEELLEELVEILS